MKVAQQCALNVNMDIYIQKKINVNNIHVYHHNYQIVSCAHHLLIVLIVNMDTNYPFFLNATSLV